jgi:hypothetical protein
MTRASLGGVAAWLFAAASALALTSAACVAANAGDRVVEVVPDRASFPPVSDLLDHRCGTLDCHGVTFRNLRIYGREGLRLSPGARPSSMPNTTPAEYDATFLSLVSLEPEIMTTVMREGGARPERLTFLRKARGTEDHKGLAIWSEGDPQDLCVTSWLAGKTDEATCRAARMLH